MTMLSLWNVLNAAILIGGSIMRRMLLLAGMICCVSVIACLAADAPKESKQADNYAVAYSGYNGVVSNQVISAPDFAKLKKQIDAEAAIFKTVLKQTEQDWKTSDSTKGKSFPGSAIHMKKESHFGPFSDVSKAVDKVKSMDSIQDKKGKALQKQKDDTNNALKLTQDQKDKADKKAKDEEAVNNLARKLFENRMIKELGPSAPGPASSNAAPSQVQGTTTNAAK